LQRVEGPLICPLLDDLGSPRVFAFALRQIGVNRRNVGYKRRSNYDHVTRSCRPSHARGDASNGQAAFALVSCARRSDDPRGHLALVYPVASSFAAVFLLGCVLIASGIVQGISLIDAREVPHFWLQLVSVVLSIIVGVLLIRHRGAGLLVLTLLLLVYFMVEGISKVIFSLTIRPFPNWGWVLASGIITILIAFYLWASLPVTAIWLLGVLLGIQLICEGAALGYLAWRVRES